MAEKIVNKDSKDLERLVSNYLRNFGVPCHLKGYQYLIEAIILAVKEPKLILAAKFIYPTVASKLGTSPASVERCIRTAIQIGYKNSNPETIKQLFGNTISKKAPTNMCFINTVSQEIKLNLP